MHELQVCKLMHNTITGFDVNHNRFTFSSSVHSQNTKFLEKMNFITERPRTRLGFNCFSIWVLSFGLVSLKLLKNKKKD